MFKLGFLAALFALALAAPEAKPDAQVGLIHPTAYTGYPYGDHSYNLGYGVSPYTKGYYGSHLGQWGLHGNGLYGSGLYGSGLYGSGLYGNGVYGNNYFKTGYTGYPGHLGYHGYGHHGYPYHGIY